MLAVEDVLRRTTEIFRCAIILANINLKRAWPRLYRNRGEEYLSDGDSISFAYFAAGVLCETSENVFGGK